MRDLGLYYVYDNINEIAITPIIPAANDLVAAQGFIESFITNEEYKKRGNYKALDLVRFATVDVSEDGEYFLNSDNIRFDEIKRFCGKDIPSFVKEKMIELGIDDDFIEENKE